MFEALQEQPKDKILALMQMYRDDPRMTKIDLGVGVYKNADGHTPIMRAVKTAEQQWWNREDTKTYVGLAGDPAFNDAMVDLVLSDSVMRDNVASIATPGGTGAVRQGFELIRMASSKAVIWVSDPTWPNHISILKYLGMPTRTYRYFNAQTGTVNFEGMRQDLSEAKPGDVVLLHGCCHNPTGANLTMDQWGQLVTLMQDKDLKPMIDIAYQGFGDGLDEDAAATRLVASSLPETLIAASCSKNFGIYRERTGILMAVAQGESVKMAQDNMAFLNRQNYSFPPDHGARLVTLILSDDNLRADWQAELKDVRNGMLRLRTALAGELKRLTNSDRFDFLANHRGMFSRLGLTTDQVETLRSDHAIYMVGDSRINIAGLNDDTIPVLAKAIVKVAS
ncbi:aromatic amino acid transaminase [Parasulfitobacter algicola]|uniref:Aspartate/tyrosine/aromatic aminotransferase n=1 Tax=Parasulfitobacter algicola TaxID=2614809 RepID=A0ABX2IUR5_9RHOB|nr:amino acid aminotransferase [Sulfitobacter algicola]NSX54577.1 aspartate/tyrosine/aromatic aminotransferase [Sulfitobacter algicola]